MVRSDSANEMVTASFEVLEPRILLSHSVLEATATRDSVSYGGQTVYIDFVKYPLETYPAKTWSDWGKGLVASNGKVYTAIGDHNAPTTAQAVAGNAFIYEYDPETKIIRCVADLQEGVSDFNASTDWGFGKVHGRINEGKDGNLYFASYWGDHPEGNPAYEGEYIFQYNPHTETLVDVNHVDGQPTIADRSMPSTNLWAEGMIFYAETTHGTTTNRDFLVYDLNASAEEAIIFLGDHDHTTNRALMVDANGDAWFNIGNNQLQQYDISARALGTVYSNMPGSDLRQVTRPDSNGYIYATTRDTYNLFRFDPATGNFKTILTLEGDVAAMELDPTEHYIYYLPYAHGPYGNSPLIQVDISDINNPVKTTIVELEDHLYNDYSYEAGGSYSLMISQDGRVVYIEMNNDFNYTPYEPSLIAVHVPAAKATFMADPEPITDPTEIEFTDVAATTGLETIVGEQYGHTSAWGDYDGDGYPDLFYGAFLDGPNRVILNNGGTSFSNDPQAAINIEDGRTSGSVFADFDNDGDLDLMITNNSKSQHVEPNRLYRNDGGGTFTNVTTGSGINFTIPFTGRNILPLDYDLDGLLDVFIQEDWFGGTNSSHLMRNTGNMVFTDVTTSAGLPTTIIGIGGAAGDFNGDGLPDIMNVAAPQIGYDNLLYVNDGDGTFHKATSATSTFNAGWPALAGDNWSAGAAIGDLDNDGDMDVVIGQHYEAAMDGSNRVQVRVYRNDGNNAGGDPLFTDVTSAVGIAGIYVKQPHVEIADFDNDGYMDISTSATIKVNGTHTPVIYRNKLGDTGTLSFELPAGMDPTVHEGYDADYGPINPHYFPGAPTVDYNLDGALDYFGVEAWPTGTNHSPLFKNTGATEEYLDVTVNFRTRPDYSPATCGNAMGIGSTVEIYEAGHSGDSNYILGSAVLQTGNGFSSGSEAVAHFGLPAYTEYSSGSNARAIGGWAQTQRFVDVRLITPGGAVYSTTVQTNQRIVLPDLGTVAGPQANFTMDTSDATSSNLLVHFDASGSYDAQGMIVSYDWDFDDGNTDTGETVNHTYSAYGTYEVSLTVENDSGVTDQKIMTLVLNTPSIVTHPQDATVQEEQQAVFTVEAAGTELSYQWQENTGGAWSDITGATDYIYVIPIASLAMSGNQYRVIVSNQFNPSGITSSAATLTVTSGPNIAPYARYYYDNSDVAPGNILVHFNAGDSYDPDGTIIEYSWDFGDTNSDAGMVVSHTYSGYGDAYSVTLTVKDDKNVTSQQILTVDVEVPHIITQPTNQTVEEWQKAEFTIEAGGTDLNIQWQVNDGGGWEDIPNANLAHYDTPYMTTADSGNQYRCILTNQYNTTGVTSNTVTVTVNANAAPTIDTDPANASASTGRKAKFWVVAGGYGEIDYQWQKNTGSGWSDVTHASGTVISKEGSITIPFWSADDAANGTQYRCVVSNGAGSDTSAAATLTVTSLTTDSEDWYVDGAGGSASYWPSNWSFQYDPAYVSSISIVEEHGYIGGLGTGEVLAWINDANGANVDQTVRFEMKANVLQFGLIARRSDSDPDTFYYTKTTSGAGMQIMKRRDGVDYELLKTAQLGVSGIGKIQRMRFIVTTNEDGDVDLRFAAWTTSTSGDWTANGDPDAVTWYSITDIGQLGGAPITTSGRYGFREWMGASGRWIKTDDYSVTVGDGVPNLQPVSRVKATPAIAERTIPIHFTGVGAEDEDGVIVSYKWDFNGDDTVDQTTGTCTTSYTYSTAGTYTVKLTVEDDDGVTARSSTQVIVHDPNASEVTIDNTSATLTGTWTTATDEVGYYGTNYVHDGNAGKGSKTGKYTPNISGSHDVYIRYVADEGNADNVPVKVVHSGGTANLTVDMTETSQYMASRGFAYEYLGTYTFSTGTSHYVEISNTGTSGYVIADAVRFVPTRSVGQVTLSSSGTPQMTIYVPVNPSTATSAAAGRLETYLEQVTGGNFTQTTWGGSGNGIKVGTVYEWAQYLPGVDEAVDLYCPEGVYVASEASDMLILAREDDGVMDAVWRFFDQDDVGVRYYTFWDDWCVVPDKPTLTANFKLVTEPWAWNRKPTGGPAHYPQYNTGATMDSWEWDEWAEGCSLSGWMIGNVSHNYSSIVPDMYFAEHPEWGSWNADLQEWRMGQINTRHPVVQEMGINYAIRQADTSGNYLISISPNDGSGFCACTVADHWGCEAHSVSDNVLEFTNIVAQGVLDRRPDLTDYYFGFYIYSAAANPPLEPHEKLPNTLGAITTGFMGGERMYEQLENWGPYVGAYGIRDYFAVNEWGHSLPTYSHARIPELLETMPLYEDSGVIFYNAEGDKGLFAHTLQYYLSSQMMWRDHRPVDEIIDDYYSDLFGGGADYVRAYEERWDNYIPLNYTTLAISYQDIDDAWDAETDTAVRNRLDDFRCYLHALKLRLDFNQAIDDGLMDDDLRPYAEALAKFWGWFSRNEGTLSNRELAVYEDDALLNISDLTAEEFQAWAAYHTNPDIPTSTINTFWDADLTELGSPAVPTKLDWSQDWVQVADYEPSIMPGSPATDTLCADYHQLIFAAKKGDSLDILFENDQGKDATYTYTIQRLTNRIDRVHVSVLGGYSEIVVENATVSTVGTSQEHIRWLSMPEDGLYNITIDGSRCEILSSSHKLNELATLDMHTKRMFSVQTPNVWVYVPTGTTAFAVQCHRYTPMSSMAVKDASGNTMASGTSINWLDVAVPAGRDNEVWRVEISGGGEFRVYGIPQLAAADPNDLLAPIECFTTTAPSAPSNLSATAVSAVQIDLAWTDNANNESGFKIERAPDVSGSPGSWAQIYLNNANDTTYSDTGLTPNTTYWYRVRATNAVGDSSYSNSDSATTQAGTVPAAPTSLSATTVSSSQIDLSWTDNANNEDGFKVERSPDGTSNWTVIATKGANVTSHSDTGLDYNTTYYYRVKAYNAVGDSSYSNTDSDTTDDVVPAAPTALTATPASTSQIDLAWTDNADNETGFKIERAPDVSGSPGTYSQIDTVGANQTSYNDTGLSSDTTYWYRVRATNAVGNSAYSNEDSATTPAGQAPAAPSALAATAQSTSQIDLSWTDNADNETGFKIERAPDVSGSPGTYSQIDTVGANVTTYNDTGLSTYTKYWYRVRATNAVGDSGYSNQASATTFDVVPAAPSGLTAEAISSSQIQLDWTDNSTNETLFVVQRSNNGTTWYDHATTPANQVWYNDTGLPYNTTYYYRVRAHNDYGNSAPSNQVSATTEDIEPAAPSDLVATAASSSRIDLTWVDNSDNEDAFLIERAPDSGGSPGTWVEIDSIAADSTSYWDVGLSHSTTYWYRVAATNNVGDSYSNTASATTSQPAATVTENWTGSDQDPWPSVWSFDNNASGLRYLDIYSNHGRVEGYYANPEPGAGYLVAYRNDMTAADVDATVRFAIKTAPMGFGMVARRADSNSDTYYQTYLETGATLKILKVVDGTSYQLLDTQIDIDTYNNSCIYDMRLKVETSGSSVVLKVKCWQTSSTADWGQNGSEPETWHEVTDNGTTGGSAIMANGRFGLYYALATNRFVYVDNYTATDTAAAVPDAPSGLTATAQSSSQIDLSWTDNSDNETGFKVERSPNGVNGWTEIATKGANVTSHSDTGLSPETTYYYRVRAYNAYGNSAYSNVDSATTQGTVPAAPSNLSATKVSSSQIDVTWTDNSSNETGFKIERAPDVSGSPGTWAQIGTVFANETTYHDTPLPYNTTFWYRVRAYNAIGDSSYSNTDSATTDNVIPAAPTNLFAAATSTSTIDLDWTDNSDNETGFKIERAPDVSGSPGTYSLVHTTAADATSWQDTGLSDETTYWYRVRATNAIGDSAYTNQASATTYIAAPSAPSNLSATAVSSSQIDLSWTDNSDNESSFQIQRSPDGSTGWTTIKTVSANVTSYSDTGLNPNTAYYYRVRASNAGGDSSWSNTDSATTQDVVPDAPSGLTATAASDTQIDLAWTDNSNNETGFKIERAPDVSGSPGTFSQIDTVGANVTTYNDTGLSAATRYHYRVRAYNGQGDSGYSNVVAEITQSGAVGYYDEDWTGSDGDPWPSQWTIETDATLIENEINNNEGWWKANPAGTAIGYINTNTAEDLDITVEYTLPKNAAAGGIMVRGTASSSDIDTYYYAEDRVGVSANTVRIYKMEAGVSTQLANTGIHHETAVWYKMRFYVETDGSSTQLKVKTWQRGTEEPAGWDAEITDDSSGLHDTSGRFGVYSNLIVVRREVRFDNFHAIDMSVGQVPAAPSGLTATKQSSSQINLSWTDNSSNENAFVIDRAPDVSGSPGTWVQIDTVAANETSYSDTGLNYNTTYHYRVKARNDYGDSVHSNTDSATTDNVAPAAPSGLTATAVSTSQIDLSWTDNADNETGFKIERAPDVSGSPGTFSQIDTVGANVTTYNNTTGLTDGTKYHYRVRATNEVGDSSYSNTDDAVTTLAAPTSLTATAQSASQIDLSWTDNSSAEAGFKIERAPDVGGSPGSWAQIDTVGANQTSYNDTGLSPGTKYHYRVRAYNTDAGNSAYSNVDDATTQAAAVTETWTGTNGDPWPSQWTTEGETGDINYQDIQDNHGRMQGVYAEMNGIVVAYINDTNAEDVEQTVRFSIKTGYMGFGLVARRADSDSDTYYAAFVDPAETLIVMKVVDGTAYELLDTEIDIGSGNDLYIYDMKFRVETSGDDVVLKVKCWETSDSMNWSANGNEPETWHSVTDDGTTGGDPIAGQGRFGFRYKLYRNRWTYTDNYTATILGGGGAPMIPGDLNGDGVVNVADLGILGASYGQSGEGLLGDLNSDGVVNVGDLGILGANYGAGLGSGLMSADGSGYTTPANTQAADEEAFVDLLTFESTSLSAPQPASVVYDPPATAAPSGVAKALGSTAISGRDAGIRTVISDDGDSAATDELADVLSMVRLGPLSVP